jgi:hypothetical protein
LTSSSTLAANSPVETMGAHYFTLACFRWSA